MVNMDKDTLDKDDYTLGNWHDSDYDFTLQRDLREDIPIFDDSCLPPKKFDDFI